MIEPEAATGRATGTPRIAKGLLALAVLGTMLAACIPDDVARDFPAGSCVRFEGSADGEHASIGRAECSGPHTHVVATWIADRSADCPATAPEKMLTPDGTLCLRPDPPPTAEP